MTLPCHTSIPLHSQPLAALFAIGIHGPALNEKFKAETYCLHLYTYSGELIVDGVAYSIRPGTASLVPPRSDTIYSFPQRSIHACAHFAFEGNEGSVDVPVLQDLGARFDQLYGSLEEAIGLFRSRPLQANVRLWDILWQLAPPVAASPETHAHHPAVGKACALIERNLGEMMTVKELASAVDLSHNQLTRLFHAAHGTTVIGYIQARRAQRAGYLLRETHLPVKTVAAQVGMDDPRLFGRLIRQVYGVTPTELRRSSFATDQEEAVADFQP